MNCAKCNKEITGSGAKFCSLKCANQFNVKRGPRKDYTRSCIHPNCDVKFWSRDSRKKYCSRSCAAKINNLGIQRNFKSKNRDSVEETTNKRSKPAQPIKHCRNCMKDFRHRVNDFCSKKCCADLRIKDWLAGDLNACNKYTVAQWAKNYVLEQANYQCEGIDNRTGRRCEENRFKESGNTVLQVDHIDGDWQNCVRENLRALCPTCHVLTPTYGAGNMGKGRTWKSGYKQYSAKK